MVMFKIFFQSMLIGYSGSLMPGSLLIYTLQKSIKSGIKAGIMVAIGHSLLELLLVLLIVAGIGQYLGARPVQLAVGVAGGLFLIFFGLSMVRDAFLGRINIDFLSQPGEKSENIILGGAIISLLNPYFLIWWAAVGLGLIMNAYKSMGTPGIALVYFGHISADISWYVGISALISRSKQFMNMRAYKAVIIILGVCLIGFGSNFLVSSAKILIGWAH